MTASTTSVPQAVAARTRVPASVSDTMLDRIRQLAPDPDVITAATVFVWRAIVSTDELDGHATRMHQDSLQTFAADARRGVAFLDSHDLRRQFGRSFDGRFRVATNGHPASVDVDFYCLRNVVTNGVDTSTFEQNVKAGIIKAISIGFSPGRYECSLCGDDPTDWLLGRCSHIPGRRYDGGDKLVSSGGRICFAWVRGAHLLECSSVYAGSNPTAGITEAMRVKTTRAVANGELNPGAVRRGQIDVELLCGLERLDGYRRTVQPAPAAPEVPTLSLRELEGWSTGSRRHRDPLMAHVAGSRQRPGDPLAALLRGAEPAPAPDAEVIQAARLRRELLSYRA